MKDLALHQKNSLIVSNKEIFSSVSGLIGNMIA